MGGELQSHVTTLAYGGAALFSDLHHCAAMLPRPTQLQPIQLCMYMAKKVEYNTTVHYMYSKHVYKHHNVQVFYVSVKLYIITKGIG